MTERKYNNDYVQDILHIISSDHTIEEKRNLLDEYHDKDIAEAFELECLQFGITLPADFVKIPAYEQMVLPCVKEKE